MAQSEPERERAVNGPDRWLIAIDVYLQLVSQKEKGPSSTTPHFEAFSRNMYIHGNLNNLQFPLICT